MEEKRATIARQLDERSYELYDDHGTTYRRNRAHLKPIHKRPNDSEHAEDMIPNLSPVAHNAPEEYLCREEPSEVIPPAQSAGAGVDLTTTVAMSTLTIILDYVKLK